MQISSVSALENDCSTNTEMVWSRPVADAEILKRGMEVGAGDNVSAPSSFCRKYTQRTICLLYGKRRLIENKTSERIGWAAAPTDSPPPLNSPVERKTYRVCLLQFVTSSTLMSLNYQPKTETLRSARRNNYAVVSSCRLTATWAVCAVAMYRLDSRSGYVRERAVWLLDDVIGCSDSSTTPSSHPHLHLCIL